LALSARGPFLSIRKEARFSAVLWQQRRALFYETDIVGKPPQKSPAKPRAPQTAASHSHFASKRRAERDARERRLGPLPDLEDDGVIRLFGLHAVAAALRNPARQISQLSLSENAEPRLVEMIGTIAHPVTRVHPRDLDKRLGEDAVHQGAMLETADLPEPSLRELASKANGRPLIILDRVTDPHNVGAILRSAAVFGAAGLIMTRRHSPPLNGVVAKAASGALDLVAITRINNLADAMTELKSLGFVIAGLDGSAETAIETLDWTKPTVIVMGAEGKGLRDLTAKTCDVLARISTEGAIASLNVSNAAAIALHTAYLARQAK
jgi:23S rRNA (guanosine2251-2'-O)-methyltransferase